MNVWICACAKMEELYIREWIEYHKSLGIDHIVLIDNNDIDYPNELKTPIQDYVDSGFVEIQDWKGVLNVQQKCYTDVYVSNRDKFDYIFNIDIDEFIELPQHNNIKQFLSDTKFKDYEAIIFGWVMMTDNGHLYYENKPVRERFTEHVSFERYKKGKRVGLKTCFKSNKDINILRSLHCPLVKKYGSNKSEFLKMCDVLGNTVIGENENLKDNGSFSNIEWNADWYEHGYIKHYYTKSTEEYIKFKMIRGRCDRLFGHYEQRYHEHNYFIYNEQTLEKLEMFKKYEQQIKESNDKLTSLYNNRIWICACAKMEELYIREWIEYHKKLNVSHIVLGDNNDIDYEPKLIDQIQDYVDEGFVEIVDIRGQKGVQQEFYSDIYNKNKNDFDWFIPIDIDEFININQSNKLICHTIEPLRAFLALPYFNDVDAIIVPWRLFGDNEQVKYKKGKVRSRFTTEIIPTGGFIGCKTFYRSREWCNKIISMHSPDYSSRNKSPNGKFIFCDVLGNKDFERKLRSDKDDNFSAIKNNSEYKNIMTLDHYVTKSTEEFIKYKILRGRAPKTYKKIHNTKRTYYSYGNKVTHEKEKMFAQYEEQIMNTLRQCEDFEDYEKNVIPEYNEHIKKELWKHDEKVWIFAIAKCEEKYIDEWIRWHKHIGVNHIVIADNNDSDYEPKLGDVIKSYIDSGFVEIVNANNILGVQQPFYNWAYNKYKDQFNWFIPIDIDEFIELPGYKNDIHEFLYDDKFENADCILLTWKCFDDNDQVYYKDKPVKQRFTRSYMDRTRIVYNGVYKYFTTVKTIYRSRPWLNKIVSMHGPTYSKLNNSPNGRFIIMDCLGSEDFIPCPKLNENNPAKNGFTRIEYKEGYYDNAYLAHYMWRSTEEYINTKILRGRADRRKKYDIRYTTDFYFRVNKVTDEKLALFKKYENIINESYEKELKKYNELKETFADKNAAQKYFDSIIDK